MPGRRRGSDGGERRAAALNRDGQQRPRPGGRLDQTQDTGQRQQSAEVSSRRVLGVFKKSLCPGRRDWQDMASGPEQGPERRVL